MNEREIKLRELEARFEPEERFRGILEGENFKKMWELRSSASQRLFSLTKANE